EYPDNDDDCWGTAGGEFFNSLIVEKRLITSQTTAFNGFNIKLNVVEPDENGQDSKVWSGINRGGVEPDLHGHLKIVEGGYPQRVAYGDKEDCRYIISADIGYGVGADYSVAYVKNYETHQTVAQFRSNKIPPVEFADCLMLLGHWYNDALIASEVNRKDLGGAVLDRLIAKEYPRIYTRKRWDDKVKKLVRKYGWLTDAVSRPRMLGHLQHLVRNEMTGNDFPEFWAEADTFNVIDGRAEAEEDCTDDCIITEGIGSYICSVYKWHGPALKHEEVTYG
ncbi:unnamed protein product, partial [marine sediment metagenome]